MAAQTDAEQDDDTDASDADTADETTGDTQPVDEDAATDDAADDSTASDTEPADTTTDGDGGATADADAETPLSCIATADVLQAFVAYPRPLVDEATIHVSETGFELTMVDPANVGSIHATLGAGAFESFAHDGAETLGVNLERLEDILGFADSDELVEMELEQKTRKLHIQVGGLEYTLALIDPDSIRDEPDIPDLDLPGRVRVDGRTLDRASTAADMVSDHIELEITPDPLALHVRADGDTDDVHFELPADDVDDLVLDADHGVASLYSMNYIDDLVGAIDADQLTTLHVGDEFPLRMELSYADGKGQVVYLLAPRIQNS